MGSSTKFQLINTGFFYADGGAMFGAIPQTAWSKRYPKDEKNRCILSMRMGLVTTDDGRVILIDNGIGTKHLKMFSSYSYQFFDLINVCDELEKIGIMPEDVTDMILTHLHFDHCGDTTTLRDGVAVPTFPRATCWVSQAQWNNFRHPNALEADAYFPENMDAIEAAGLLRLIDEECTLGDTVRLRLYDGHTAGQIAPYITTSEHTIVFAGDVIPVAAQISPTWISGFDTSPLLSYEEKWRMLEEAAAEHQLLIHYHDAYTPCTTVKKINNFFKIKDHITL